MTFRRQTNTENKHKKTNHDCKQMLNDYKDTEMTIKGKLAANKSHKKATKQRETSDQRFFNLVKYRISKKKDQNNYKRNKTIQKRQT